MILYYNDALTTTTTKMNNKVIQTYVTSPVTNSKYFITLHNCTALEVYAPDFNCKTLGAIKKLNKIREDQTLLSWIQYYNHN